jgi:hypothetical protein
VGAHANLLIVKKKRERIANLDESYDGERRGESLGQ